MMMMMFITALQLLISKEGNTEETHSTTDLPI
jgi:hypothetical protein